MGIGCMQRGFLLYETNFDSESTIYFLGYEKSSFRSKNLWRLAAESALSDDADLIANRFLAER